MRVLMLSWEYPPVLVGGLGRHVHGLARHLAQQGHEVIVLCRQPTGTDAGTHPTSDTAVAGVRIVRVAEDPLLLDFEGDTVGWALAMGHVMTRIGWALVQNWPPDVIHAHDWLVAHPAIALAQAASVPLIATVHGIEAARQNGKLVRPVHRQIHSIDWWMVNAADAVITCSSSMRSQIVQVFHLDADLVHVIPNGIEPVPAVPPGRVSAACRRHVPAGGPLILFFGRLVEDKGAHDLLDAFPDVRRRYSDARLVIAGDGKERARLRRRAGRLLIADAVDFVGHLHDQELAAVLGAADLVVIPSRQESFGLAALEAARAHKPVVAAATGGLAEIVVDGQTGTTFPPGDVAALASAVVRALGDPAGAARQVAILHERLGQFDWASIALSTADLYAASVVRVKPVLSRAAIPTDVRGIFTIPRVRTYRAAFANPRDRIGRR